MIFHPNRSPGIGVMPTLVEVAWRQETSFWKRDLDGWWLRMCLGSCQLRGSRQSKRRFDTRRPVGKSWTRVGHPKGPVRNNQGHAFGFCQACSAATFLFVIGRYHLCEMYMLSPSLQTSSAYATTGQKEKESFLVAVSDT